MRADRIWITIAGIGTAAFAFLTWMAIGFGMTLGAAYTGQQEFVPLTIGLALLTACYAVLTFELFYHRKRWRHVLPGTVTAVSLGMILVGIASFVLTFVVTSL